MKYFDDVPYVAHGVHGEDFFAWNPLTDDGDTLRLAVKLAERGNVILTITNDGVVATQPWPTCASAREDIDRFMNPSADLAAATRRAIVRAAAEIGKAQP
jgi:hypothetical protein